MFNRIVSSVAARLPATSSAKRKFVSTAFWHLQDVVYTRLRDAGFAPSYIIDIGACSGDWSRSVRQVFPSAEILMVEARSEETTNLEKAAAEIGNSNFAICLLGPTPKEAVSFSVAGTGSSLFQERSNVQQVQSRLPMTTLDAVAKAKEPTFLKIDVQGAELEVLKGAEQTLARCEIVQLETALLQYNEGAPTSAEVIAFMDRHDFALFDVAGFVRPLDQHLVQLDLLFARKISKLRPARFEY